MRTLTHTDLLVSLALLSLACGEAQIAAPEPMEGAPTVPAAAPAAAPQASPAPTSDGVQLKKFQIVDASGFERPIVAIQLLAPADWKLEGGVRWNPNYRCSADMVSAHARLVSPDTRYAFEIFPIYMTEWLDDDMARNYHIQAVQNGGRGCPVAQTWNTQQFVSQVLVPGFRPGARVVAAEERPDVARKLYETTQQVMGANARVEVDSARVRLEYEGQEEWIVGSAMRMIMNAPSMTAAMYGQTGGSFYRMTTSDRVFGFRAPRGELDANQALFERMVSSLQLNPQWQQRVNQVRANITSSNSKAAMERSRLASKTNQEIMQMNHDSWKRRQEISDRGQREFTEYIRGTETYSDQSTGDQWELESGYNQVWKNGTDDFLYSNDANFNPNVELDSGNWNELPVTP